MARKKNTNRPAGLSRRSCATGRTKGDENVVDYRHKGVTRLNIPPAGIAARGQIVKEPKLKWAFNPHLAPALRFDATGKADNIEDLIKKAGKQKLEPAELAILEEAFRNHEPWLEWAGKREQQWCVADPVALHIHERISTQAILKVARRLDVERDLFADPEHEYREAVQFYKHKMDWTNRMILGDLVLDPTCGSGTTVYVAENWGRRWITIDCSRVALAIARQRLLTAKFDFFQLRPTSAEDVQRNPDGPWLSDPAGQIQGSCTFDCKTVPHVTLKSIAQNPALDPIFDNWEPILAEKLAELNKALASVTDDLRRKLALKLAAKEKADGKKAVTDADRRRWILPIANPKSKIENGQWQHWQVPFDTDPDWPKALQEALAEYRKAWRQKMDEVNACITARADQEELVDQPNVERSKVRVSGPFTMEGIIPAEESIDDSAAETPIAGAPEELETFEGGPGAPRAAIQSEPQNAEAYLDRMIRLLRDDGVRFPDNKVMKFSPLEALADGSTLHAKGAWANGDKKDLSAEALASAKPPAEPGSAKAERQVAVMFGPQYGPLIAPMVEDGIRVGARRGFDDLVFAAFSFDGAAQAAIQGDPDPKLRIHMAQIRPDVNMGDLLKTTVSSQLFTVSGSPRTKVEEWKDGPASAKASASAKATAGRQFVVHMEGVDIYDPVTNTVRSTGADKVSAWFLDSDYDGRCFCVCQAFFPDKSAWEKLGKALGGALDEDAFAKLSGTVSLPFPEGEHKRIAVKVIDPRGNEVLK